MNLKQAAAQLGVHYQTAYKWVRAGDLAAIRVGGRYEVSPAAITQFLASRSQPTVAFPPVRPPADLTREDALEELEALAREPFLSVHAIATFAANQVANAVGDLCVISCFHGPDDSEVCAVSHPNSARTVSVASAMDVADGQLRTSHGMAYAAYAEQRAVRVPHVPQDHLRKAIRPELRQHLARYPVHSVLAAPVIVAGAAVGVVVVTRDTPDRPYTDADDEFMVRLCTRIGALFESASEMEQAWRIRADLVEALRALPDTPNGTTPQLSGQPQKLIEAHAEGGLPVAILDPELRFLGMNATFLRAMGYSADAVRGQRFEDFVHPDDRTFEQHNFARLVSGELDYLDIQSRRLLADGTDVAYASHRAAIREPDATLRAIVTVARPLHIPKVDYAAVIAGRAHFAEGTGRTASL